MVAERKFGELAEWQVVGTRSGFSLVGFKLPPDSIGRAANGLLRDEASLAALLRHRIQLQA